MDHGIVQLHLTRRCNLRCAHCYSESGPHARGELDLATVLGFLDRARRAGYSYLSLSGGEPFLYARLPALLAHARASGWRTSLVTNGTLLQRPGSWPMLDFLDLVGVSLDGRPERHAALRGSATSYQRAVGGMEVLRQRGVPFAIVHTLSRQSLQDLPWLVDEATRLGAERLRLHPLEAAGFGQSLGSARLTPAEAAEVMLWVLARRATGAAASLPIDIDLMNRERIRHAPELLWAPSAGAPRSHHEVADPLVVEPDGAVVPFTFGLARPFALGRMEEPGLFAGSPEAWAAALGPLVHQAMQTALELDWPFFNWFEHLVATSHVLGVRAEAV